MIFSTTTQRAIRNKGMAAVYGLAAEFDCEPGDVLDLLVTTSFTPSQPDLTSLRTAADTPANPPAGVTTDGPEESSPLPTGPSVDLIPPSPVAGDPADEAGTQTLVASTSSAAFSKPPTLAQRIRDHLAEHPDATLREVSEAIGGNMKAVGWAAQKAGITLRKRNAQERSEASARGAQGRAKPSGPIAAPDETAIQPDETVMPEPQALRQYRPAPPTTARFYLRDREGRFVHQSLQACPTGPGPLMTSDRKWAWCDNFQRFKGARKLWPEIATMRREGAAS